MKFIPYLFVLLLFIAWNCNRRDPNAPPEPTGLSGKELAAIHCASCHVQPMPEMLDKMTWKEGVMPQMAYYLGMRGLFEKMTEVNPDDIVTIMQAKIYPDKPLLVEADWQKIVDYYIENAPEKPLPQASKALVTLGLPFFEIKTIEGMSDRPPMVTMLKIDTTNGHLYAGRRDKRWLEIYDKTLKRIDSIGLESPVSDIYWNEKQELLTLQMGIMDPNDSPKGKLIQNQGQTLLDSLRRPVHLLMEDLNEDGTPDYLICNYGNEVGHLSWYDGKNFQAHTLKDLPGARNTILYDMNNDGRLDIITLFCQSRESIYIFYNNGNGTFKEEKILEFPPVYGSSFIELADMNGDGKPDILYTNGDNADYSLSLKNYHGLRIFLNDGQNHFTERFFYPIYGASKVQAADFDGDGDLDLATIAFFNNVHQQPNEGFLFFENKGNFQFEISTFAVPGSTWLVMDVGDLDQDGRLDIVLGNFFKPGMGRDLSSLPKQPAVVWLRNIAPKATN
ncbi:MAG: VCBS repeat-containing protein [Saprospiraceae bacterium]|nr:VCBS repeat-containing protein [Saprospiraceae bacterium]